MMKHDQYEELLFWWMEGELDPSRVEQLRRHLEQCPDCARRRRQWEQLRGWIARSGLKSSQEELERARAGLRSRLVRTRAATAKSFSFSLPWALASAASLLLGMALGGLLLPSRGPNLDPFGGDLVQVQKLRFLDKEKGRLELTLLTSRLHRLEGSLQDRHIQAALVSAMVNDPNPAMRLAATSALQGGSRDGALRRALIRTVLEDPNPAVRERALAALRRYPPDEEIEKTFLEVLVRDENAKLRIEAIRALEEGLLKRPLTDSRINEVLRRKSREDENGLVRLRAQAFLKEVHQP